MEPAIHKTGAYKKPGVYKGAGGIYNGRGVYNDGAGGYNGPFVLLNNFENLEDNISISEIGPNFNANSNSFRLENSSVFIGKKCLFKFGADDVANTTENIIMDNIFTCETYFSNFVSIASNQICEVRFGEIFIELWGLNSQFRVQAKQSNYNIFNGASYHTTVAGWNYYTIPIQVNENCHVAIVVIEKDAYIFFNGTLYLQLMKTDNFLNEFKPLFTNEVNANINVAINFYCARNGDFSNNLNSFDVPTQKYNL